MQNLGKFHQYVPKILSRNKILTSIKGHNSVINLQKLTYVIIPTQILSVSMHMQNLVKFHQFGLKILREKEKQISMKGHNSVINLQKLMYSNPNLDLVNINAYAKSG